MEARNAYWKQSAKKSILGFIQIKDGYISFTKDNTNYSIGSIKIATRREHNQDKARGLFSKLFKKAANICEEFEIEKSEITSFEVNVNKVERYNQKGTFYFANILTINTVEEQYVIEIAADEEEFTEKLKGELKV